MVEARIAQGDLPKDYQGSPPSGSGLPTQRAVDRTAGGRPATWIATSIPGCAQRQRFRRCVRSGIKGTRQALTTAAGPVININQHRIGAVAPTNRVPAVAPA